MGDIGRTVLATLKPGVLLAGLLAVSAQAAGSDLAPPVSDPDVAITFGVYCKTRSVDSTPAPGTHAGYIDIIPQALQFQWTGRMVPAAPGIGFGVNTEILDGPGFANVTIVTLHPPFTGTETTEQRYSSAFSPGSANSVGYSFDLPEELVPGIWTMEAWADERLIYRVPFTIVAAGQMPGIANACGQNLLS